ncbi:MAG: ABC transporter ATP-binding protein [Egibacteraceae bacterium]
MSGTETPVLELRGIRKVFGSVVANDEITLDLRRGEVHGLLGENGAGKSTLMKILYGLYTADEGEIRIDGEPTVISGPKDAVEHGIGMVHQHFMLVPTLTVAENVALGAEPGGVRLDLGAAEDAVEQLSARYGLRVDPRAQVGDLSVGVQQRVEVLKTLYRDARILVLDEPTAVLTPQETDELFGVLRGFVEEGLAVFLITHKLGELLDVSDRITVIRDGKVIDTVPAAETDERELARLMVGREVSLHVERDESERGEVRLEARGLVVEGGGGRKAVDEVDLAVHGGEILAVAGVDGNGQVELAEALAGVRSVSEGTVHLEGEDVTGRGAAELKARGLAYIPEDRSNKGLVSDFTLSENFALRSIGSAPFSRLGWLRPGAIRRHAAQRIKDYDVRPPNPDATAGSLSGGNQQKAVAARELGDEPGVLIANQPTRGVDVGAIEFIHGQLLEARARGAAILLISLELEEIHQLADRIVVLYNGQLVGEVEADEATDEQLGLWMAGRTSSGEDADADAEERS